MRIHQSALKLKKKLLSRCDGNPYKSEVSLKSVFSSAVIPDAAKDHIVNMAKLGQEIYEDFVKERLLLSCKMSIWDIIKKLKLQIFSS